MRRIVEDNFKEEVKRANKEALDKYWSMDTGSFVDTNNPLSNEYVEYWNKSGDGLTYLLLQPVEGYLRMVILAGYVDSYGHTIVVSPDGPDSGNPAALSGTFDVVAVAETESMISNFPTGKYQLYVMK